MTKQWVQSQLDGKGDIPLHEKARALQWTRGANAQQLPPVVADDVLDLRALDPEPTTFALTTLGSGQEVWIPTGMGAFRLTISIAPTHQRHHALPLFSGTFILSQR